MSEVTRLYYRGSYECVHVLLNLLNELRKRDKMRGLSSVLLLFCKEFNKFNSTGARMLILFFHIPLNLLRYRIFGVKTSFTQLYK